MHAMEMSRERLFAALTVAGLLMLGGGCSKPAAPEDPDVLARIGNRVIRVADLQAEAARRMGGGRPVGDKSALLRELVQREALKQQGLRLGLQDDPDVSREMDILLVSKLKDRELLPRQAKVQISDAALAAEYQRRIAEFTRPAQVRLAGLMLQCERGASDATRADTRARLEEARKLILASPAPGGRGPAAQGFGAVAIQYSDDQASRYRGGDLGWLKTAADCSRWPLDVVQAGFALEKGRISDVLPAADGFYLVMKSDERPAQVTPLETVRENLRRQLENQEREAIASAYVEEVLKMADPYVNEARLSSVELPAPSRAGGDAVAGFQPPVMSVLETNAHAK
jgi:peptidyl-prolyl cis-trans isomerase C